MRLIHFRRYNLKKKNDMVHFLIKVIVRFASYQQSVTYIGNCIVSYATCSLHTLILPKIIIRKYLIPTHKNTKKKITKCILFT